MMACAVVKSINHEALSALPNAPVIPPRPAGNTRRGLVRLQGLLARLLHQAAWAIEPHSANHRGRQTLSQGELTQ
ncbi:hypothetical protein ABH924_004170 [Arthrobacter sp. GAS37]